MSSLHNYVVNYGSTGFNDSSQLATVASVGSGATAVAFGGAPFEPGKSIKFGELTDGLSQTLLAAEVVQGRPITPGKLDIRGLIWWGPYSGFMSFLKPNDSQPDTVYSASLCDWVAPNPPCQGAAATANYPFVQAARSRHTGGVQVVLVDGSARFVRDSIPIDTWRKLSSSRDGQAVTDDY